MYVCTGCQLPLLLCVVRKICRDFITVIVDLRWCCVALVFVTADAASSWKAKLATTRIPEAVKQNILVRYDEQDLLVTCFRKESGFDAWIKSLLVTESHPIATEASWSVHPVAGMIRCLWLDACASSPGDAERGTKQDRAPSSLSLLPLSGSGSRLDAGEREKLKKKVRGKLSGNSPQRSNTSLSWISITCQNAVLGSRLGVGSLEKLGFVERSTSRDFDSHCACASVQYVWRWPPVMLHAVCAKIRVSLYETCS